MASKKKSGGKGKSKQDALMHMVGIEKDHVRAGKMTAVVGLGSAPLLECWDGVSPLDYIFPNPAVADQVNGMSVGRRMEYFARGCAQNLAGRGAPEGATPGSGSMMSGKIVVAGSVVHVIGEAKIVKKLTKGLPIRP